MVKEQPFFILSHIPQSPKACQNHISGHLPVTDYQVAEDHIRGQFTSRADLADCMLKQLTTDQYSRKVMAVATFSVQPSMVKFMLQEAFKEPSKS